MPTSDYLIDPILRRGTLSILQGSHMAGKTYLLMQLVAALQSPDPDFFGLTGLPGATLALLTCDQSPMDYRDTALTCGADLSTVQWYSYQSKTHRKPQDEHLFDASPYDLMMKLCNEMYDNHAVDLFIIEPGSTWLDVDLIQDKPTLRRMSKMSLWLSDRNCCMLLTAFANKARLQDGWRRAIDRIHTSMAFPGHAQAEMALDQSQEITKHGDVTSTLAKLTIVTRHTKPQDIWMNRPDGAKGQFILVNRHKGLVGALNARQRSLIDWVKSQPYPPTKGAIKADWVPLSGIADHTPGAIKRMLNRDLQALLTKGLLAAPGDGTYVLTERATVPDEPTASDDPDTEATDE